MTYIWDNGSDPSLNERHGYHWHITEGDKQLVERWCELNGYTDMFVQQDAPDKFWAYPPNCIMPEPIKLENVQQWFKIEGERTAWT